jgi:hypothetical protein
LPKQTGGFVFSPPHQDGERAVSTWSIGTEQPARFVTPARAAPEVRHIVAAIEWLLLCASSDTGLSFAPFGCIAKKEHTMPITTLKVLSTVLQLHGPGATLQSDHQGINAVLNDLRSQDAEATQVYFRRGGFLRGGGYGGGFRRAGYGGGGFRRGGFIRAY